MEYLNYLLTFCAIAVLFEFGWTLISFAFLGVSMIFRSETVTYWFMVIDKICYCFFLMTSVILTIKVFRVFNPTIVFMFFMLIIAVIYFVFFFANKRKNAQELLSKKTKYVSNNDKMTFADLIIEYLAIIAFIPFSFFPELVNNFASHNIYLGLNYIATMKYIGVILGLFGIFSLLKYLFTISLFSILLSKK